MLYDRETLEKMIAERSDIKVPLSIVNLTGIVCPSSETLNIVLEFTSSKVACDLGLMSLSLVRLPNNFELEKQALENLLQNTNRLGLLSFESSEGTTE